MADEPRAAHDRHDVQWRYAKQCWNALKAGEPLPPVPNFNIYEERDGKRKLVKRQPITPMKITFDGVEYYG